MVKQKCPNCGFIYDSKDDECFICKVKLESCKASLEDERETLKLKTGSVQKRVKQRNTTFLKWGIIVLGVFFIFPALILLGYNFYTHVLCGKVPLTKFFVSFSEYSFEAVVDLYKGFIGK